MKKNILNIIVIIVITGMICLLSILFYGIIIGGGFVLTVGKDAIEKEFERSKEYILILNEYLINSKDGEIYIGNKEDIPKDKTEIREAYLGIRKKGYRIIDKSHNAISFLRWSKLDAGGGIVYSIDGCIPKLQFLTKLEPLKESNWYYYEEDFNEWRKHNQ